MKSKPYMARYVFTKGIALLLITLVCMSVSSFPTQAKSKNAPKLNKTKATIYVGNTTQLTLKNSVYKKVKWISKNKKVAKVTKKGVVTGLSAGKAKITATYKSKKYTATVTVKKSKLNRTGVTLYTGSSYKLSVSKLKGKVKWTSSNNSVVTVSAKGNVKAKNRGSATVSAKVQNVTYKCKFTVVAALNASDFNNQIPDKDGFVTFIDRQRALDYNRRYIKLFCQNDKAHLGECWDELGKKYDDDYEEIVYDDIPVSKENRGVELGDTYNDVIKAYGETEKVNVLSYDDLREYFKNAQYPRVKLKYCYVDRERERSYFYKQFYFDRNNNLVLAVWWWSYDSDSHT